jgi:hypothetical protein
MHTQFWSKHWSKPPREKITWKFGSTYKEDIKIHLKETGCDTVYCTHVT